MLQSVELKLLVQYPNLRTGMIPILQEDITRQGKRFGVLTFPSPLIIDTSAFRFTVLAASYRNIGSIRVKWGLMLVVRSAFLSILAAIHSLALQGTQ